MIPYEQALSVAESVQRLLEPFCLKCEIAGSIRRKKKFVGDIEIVAIPHPYETGLFGDTGVASVINKWTKVKGELPCKYTQRILPNGMVVDLFFATPENWGWIFAIRTGSAEYSHRVLAHERAVQGYNQMEGCMSKGGNVLPVYEEKDLFKLLGVEYIEPELREK